jgi:hypothetical protein
MGVCKKAGVLRSSSSGRCLMRSTYYIFQGGRYVMMLRGFLPKPAFVPVSLAVGAMLGLGMFTLAVKAAEPAKKIEIEIKQGGVAKVVSGYTLTDVPTEIVVRNEDAVTHGFNSSMFGPSDNVELVAGGTVAEGKKAQAHVYRVDPGKTMVLRFTKSQQDVGSMTYAFWCDLHRATKGEMLVVDFRGESGG